MRAFKPTPATVLALLALIFAMAGTGLAAKSYVISSSSQIKDGAITGQDIKKSTITGTNVKDRSLTPSDFNGSVQGPAGPQGPQGVPGQVAGTAAGGALTGSYPNPGLAAQTVSTETVADGSLRLVDLHALSLGTSGEFSGTFAVPASACRFFGSSSSASIAVGLPVVTKVVEGKLPELLYLPITTTAPDENGNARATSVICNSNYGSVDVQTPFVIERFVLGG